MGTPVISVHTRGRAHMLTSVCFPHLLRDSWLREKANFNTNEVKRRDIYRAAPLDGATDLL